MKVLRSSDSEWSQDKTLEKRIRVKRGALDLPFSYLQEVRLTKGRRVPPHFHRRQTEIFYFLSKGSLNINKERLNLQQGDIVVCEPLDVHEVPAAECDFSILVFKLDYEEDDTTWIGE